MNNECSCETILFKTKDVYIPLHQEISFLICNKQDRDEGWKTGCEERGVALRCRQIIHQLDQRVDKWNYPRCYTPSPVSIARRCYNSCLPADSSRDCVCHTLTPHWLLNHWNRFFKSTEDSLSIATHQHVSVNLLEKILLLGFVQPRQILIYHEFNNQLRQLQCKIPINYEFIWLH